MTAVADTTEAVEEAPSGDDGGAGAAPSIGRVVLVAVAAVTAGLQLHRAFTLAPLVLPVVGAAVAAAALSLVGRRLFARPGPSAILSAAGFVLLSGVLVFPETAAAGFVPTADTIEALRDALVNGWARIVTTSLPLDDEPDLLAVAYALTWVAAAVGAELVLRTRARLAAGIPAVVAFVVATAAGIGGGGTRFVLPTVLVVALALLAVSQPGPVAGAHTPDGAGDDRARPGRGAVVRGLAGLSVVVLVAVIVGPRLPGRDAYDPRDLSAPPIEDRESVNPLALLAGWAADPTEPLFQVTAARPLRTRLAVLDTWDGTGWSSDARFVSVGQVLPDEDGQDLDEVQRVAQQIEIRGLDTAWVPVADEVVEVTGSEVLVDLGTGTVLAPGGEASGVEVSAVSEVPVARPDRYRVAAPGPSAAGGSPSVPPELATLAAEVTGATGATTPYERAVVLEDHFTSTYGFDPDAPPGHSAGRLLSVLGVAPADPSVAPTADAAEPAAAEPVPATSEQFATAFALMTLSLGIPTRVAVGFHAGRETSPGVHVVRGADAYAWPEIHLRGHGWVAFDPTPREDGTPPPPEQATEEQLTEDAEKDVIVDQTQDPDAPPDPAAPGPAGEGATDGGGAPWPVLIAAGLVIAVIVYVVAVTLLRRRQRATRRRGDPAGRVLGAWSDVLDTMAEVGSPARDSDTTAQVVAHARDAMGPDAGTVVGDLRPLVVTAAYSARPPDAAEADIAWRMADRFSAVAFARLPLRVRVARRLHPRIVAVRWRA